MDAHQPLDSVSIDQTPQYEHAEIWRRFVNLLIDYAIILVLVGIVIGYGGSGGMGTFYLGFYGGFFAYYTIMEYAWGRTIGKFVTGTMVVRERDLEKINISQAMGRSISRFVPFEPFSFFGSIVGWHDKWNGTIVIKVKSFSKGNI